MAAGQIERPVTESAVARMPLIFAMSRSRHGDWLTVSDVRQAAVPSDQLIEINFV